MKQIDELLNSSEQLIDAAIRGGVINDVGVKLFTF